MKRAQTTGEHESHPGLVEKYDMLDASIDAGELTLNDIAAIVEDPEQDAQTVIAARRILREHRGQ